MNDQNDDAQNYALMVLAGVVALVIGGVIALTSWKTMGHAPVAAAGAAGGSSAQPVAATAGTPATGPEGRIYFEVGSAALPAEASAVLVMVADTARVQVDKVVLISGYHDATGDAAQNAELAKNRALAVRHALEANGVAPDRLVMDKPIVATGGTDPREARRVEMRLR